MQPKSFIGNAYLKISAGVAQKLSIGYNAENTNKGETMKRHHDIAIPRQSHTVSAALLLLSLL